jgi:4-hydroxybutyrate CoA-transferase
MQWQEEYRKKMISAEEAAKLVKSGDRLVFSAGRETISLGKAIAARRDELRDVRVFMPNPLYDFGWYALGSQESFKVTIGLPTIISQEAIDSTRVDFEVGSLIPYEEGPDTANRRPDVLLVEVSEPDEHGFCSFGSSVWNKRRHIKEAKLTIAEVNKNLIRTYGDNYIHISEISYFVEHVPTGRVPGTSTLASRQPKAPEPYVKRIAENVGQLLRDGDTVQIGIGRTTEPLIKMGILDGRKDIGWHSEATPPGVISMVRQGVINGSRKTLNPGKCVVTSIGGSSQEEMEWVNMNPRFLLVDVVYLADIRVLVAHDSFVAINNALLVDLGGQIAAETLGTRLMSQAGGQIPFVIGANMSKGGRSITCLPSTAQGGKVSRIVPTLPQGTVVTIQRNLADHIVTEYGVAKIKGKTLRQRAQALIDIAHPDFREELGREAAKLFGT